MATISRTDLGRADALDGLRPVLIVDREYETSHGMVGVLGLDQHAHPVNVQYRLISDLLIFTDAQEG